MKLFLITLLLIILISLLSILYPNAKLTITADSINHCRRKIFEISRSWTDNRIQERRIAKNLVQHDQLFSYMPNNDLEKAFARTKIMNSKGKKLIIIPTKSYEVSKMAKEQLDGNSTGMLTKYYPNFHWQPAKIIRIRYTNLFLTIITEK